MAISSGEKNLFRIEDSSKMALKFFPSAKDFFLDTLKPMADTSDQNVLVRARKSTRTSTITSTIISHKMTET